MSHYLSTRIARTAFGVCTMVLALASPSLRAQKADPVAPPVPNYDLAAQWTSQKVGKLVFDTTVSPQWLETSDRFWYTYRTREGRRFSIVDPIKKTKAPLFDHAKMAATLTTITRIPYDAQHLPFSNVRFVKKDTAIEFDVPVPADAVIAAPAKRDTTTEPAAAPGAPAKVAVRQPSEPEEPQQRTGQTAAGAGARSAPRTKTLHFEYDLATARVSLLEEDPHNARLPRWASLSPDEKTVVFSNTWPCCSAMEIPCSAQFGLAPPPVAGGPIGVGADGRADRPPVGQGRLGSGGNRQVRPARAGDAQRPASCPRPDRGHPRH